MDLDLDLDQVFVLSSVDEYDDKEGQRRKVAAISPEKAGSGAVLQVV